MSYFRMSGGSPMSKGGGGRGGKGSRGEFRGRGKSWFGGEGKVRGRRIPRGWGGGGLVG